ncbi:MAG: type II toxin-antitoxin system VapC family toxin [Alphaproteobacteria bacterium]|nr:type II toxin-antitoxin system VapC family toxin [Alphaproteobacteria bacterium]
MRLLLDTHAFIWWRAREQEISNEIRAAIQDADDVFVSVVSAWEIAIKTSVGKFALQASVEEGIRESHFEILPIDLKHTDAVAALPFHHRDPFDRMLIAQCQVEKLTLVTADRRLQPYDVPFLWM